MAMDLGTLFATIDIKDDGWAKKIAAAKTDLEDLAKAAEAAAKVKVDVTPKGQAELDKAADAAEKVDKQLDETSKKKVDVTPTGTKELDRAGDSAKDLGVELDKVDKKKPDVAPTGQEKLDKAGASAKTLGRDLDEAGRKAPDVAPKGTKELDKAGQSAKDLGKDLDAAGRAKPDIAPTGTGEVSTAADEARRLARELAEAQRAASSVVMPQNLSNEVGAVGAATGGLVDKLGQVSSKAIKWGAMTAGAGAAAAAVGTVGTALTKGFERLDNIDQANAKLTGLGHSAEDISGIMDSAMASVKGTAFGFGEAASLAGQMVASGIKPGEELTQVLTTVADTATIGGRSLEDMGLIFGSVAARGKLQGDDLLQLMAGGIPVLQMLADETGKTAEEVSEMASKGEIDFATFESAMRNHLGGAAQAAGQTFSGSMDNAKAALGRLGASFLEPVFKQAPGIIGGITSKIDEMGPQAEAAGAKLADFAQGAIPQVQAAFSTLTDSAQAVWPAVQKIGDVATSIPWQAYASLIAMAVAKHQGLTGALSSGSGKLKAFTADVAANRAAMQAQGHEIGVVSAAMQTLGTKSAVVGKMNTAFQNASTPLRVMGMESRAAATTMTGLGRAATATKGGLQSFGGVLSGTVAGGFSLAKSGASGLLNALGGPWGVVIGTATAVIGGLIQKHQEAKAAEEEHKQAQQALKDSLDETNGSITQQTKDLQLKSLEESGARQTATDLGIATETLADATTGNAAAMAEVNNAIDAQMGKAADASSLWQSFKGDLEGVGISYQDVANSAEGVAGAQEKLDDAIKNSDLGIEDKDALKNKINELRLEMDDSTRSAAKLRGEVGDLGGDAAAASASKAAEALNNFRKEADSTSQIMGELGDKQASLGKDPTELSVQMNPTEFQKVKGQLDEIGADYDFSEEDGVLNLSLPNGGAIMATLGQIKGDLVSFPDGSIDIKSNSQEVQDQLVKLGLAVKDPITGEIKMKDDVQEKLRSMQQLKQSARIDGKLYLNTNTGQVQAALDGVGIKTRTLPPGDVRIMDNTPETRAHLDDLNIKTVTLPDGRIAISDTSPENIAALDALGIKTTTMPGGFIQIDDTSPQNIQQLTDLGVKTTTLPDGRVVISDNAGATKDNIFKILGHGAVNTVSEHTVNIVRNIKDIFKNANGGIGKYANGGVNVDYFAGGGQKYMPEPSRGAEDHTAQIAKAGSWRVWAEPETGGEAYIPLSEKKRERSTQILNQVATGFGYTLTDRNGEPYRGQGVETAAGGPVEAFAKGGIRTNAELHAFVEGKSVGGVQANRSLQGAPYTNTPAMGEWGDCSSTQSAIASFIVGEAPFPRKFATGTEDSALRSLGFTIGNGPSGSYRIGWMNGGPGGGHTSGTLPDGTNVEMGGGNNGGAIGGGAAAWNDPLFTDHAWIMPNNIPVGNAGLDGMFDGLGTASGYSSAGGSSSSGSGTTTEKSINGGNGTLFKDGSVLDLAAAVYSKQTGTPMPDDVVSWGQVLGLQTEITETGGAGGSADSSKMAEKRDKLQSDLDKANDALPLAEEDLRIKKMKRDDIINHPDATEVQKAQANQYVEKEQKKVDDLHKKIDDLQRQLDELDAQQAAAGDDLTSVYDGLDSNLPGSSGNRNADGIIREGRRRGISDQGIKIALATALVESGMQMYANPAVPASMNFPHDAVGGDADSVGLFQQRDNGAWGTIEDRMDPERSAGMFYDVLDDADYNTGDPGAHAQRVQRSAFPDRYNTKMGEAQGYLDRFGATDQWKNSDPISVTAMASGGILGAARGAQINEGSATLWAEAGPEAYIPLSKDKRARSIDIWAETGKRLGIDMVSLLQLMGSGIPDLIEGNLDGFSTGGSISLDRYGLNTDAAAWNASRTMAGAGQQVVGAVFNGPVQVNDPRQWVQGQVNDAGRMLDKAMKGVMLR